MQFFPWRVTVAASLVVTASLLSSTASGASTAARAATPAPSITLSGHAEADAVATAWEVAFANTHPSTWAPTINPTQQLRNRLVDIAVVSQPDTPGTADPTLRAVPLFGQAIWIGINLHGSSGRITGLRLSSTTAARLLTGQIAAWNDPSIQADNPGRSLPSTPVTVVVPADGSLAHFEASRWMAATEPAIWNAYTASVGIGSAPVFRWPTRPGWLTGTTGVLAVTEGAIGLDLPAGMFQKGIPPVALQNRSGTFVTPSAATAMAALRSATVGADGFASAPAQGGSESEAYPIVEVEHALVLSSLASPRNAWVGGYLRAAVCLGQRTAADYDGAPLTVALTRHALDVVAAIDPSFSFHANAGSCPSPAFAGPNVGAHVRVANTAARDGLPHPHVAPVAVTSDTVITAPTNVTLAIVSGPAGAEVLDPTVTLTADAPRASARVRLPANLQPGDDLVIEATSGDGADLQARISVGDPTTVRPSISVLDASTVEGSRAAVQLRVDPPSTAPITIDYAVTTGTLTRSDVRPFTGTVTIPAGGRVATVEVPTKYDGVREPVEAAVVRVTKVSSAQPSSLNDGLARVWISDSPA